MLICRPIYVSQRLQFASQLRCFTKTVCRHNQDDINKKTDLTSVETAASNESAKLPSNEVPKQSPTPNPKLPIPREKISLVPDDLTAVNAVGRPPIRQEAIKKIACQYHGVPPGTFDDNTVWYPVYQQPHIGRARFVVRLKLYLTFTSITASVIKTVQYLTTSDGDLKLAIFLSFFSLTGLTLIGDIARRVIFQVYTSENCDYVRFCRFSFLGRRIDMVVPLTVLVPLTDTNPSQYKYFLTLKLSEPQRVDLSYDMIEFYDSKFWITLSHGGVLDRHRFETIFGKILKRR